MGLRTSNSPSWGGGGGVNGLVLQWKTNVNDNNTCQPTLQTLLQKWDKVKLV